MFQHHAQDLTKRFRERDYPRPLISQAYRRAKGSERRELLQAKPKTADKAIRFITPYNNQWNDLRKVLDNRWCILQSDYRLKVNITDRPLLTARRAPSLRDILVESHFSRPTTRLNRGNKLYGTYPCGDCTVCQYIKPATTFKNLLDGEIHQTKCYINCKTRYVVYCIQCPCSKIYVGQTSQELRKRIQKHLSTISLADRDNRQKKKLTSLAEHFLTKHRGRPSGMQVFGLEKVPPWIRGGDPTRLLLQKESRWIFTLGALKPAGLNEELTFTGCCTSGYPTYQAIYTDACPTMEHQGLNQLRVSGTRPPVYVGKPR